MRGKAREEKEGEGRRRKRREGEGMGGKTRKGKGRRAGRNEREGEGKAREGSIIIVTPFYTPISTDSEVQPPTPNNPKAINLPPTARRGN